MKRFLPLALMVLATGAHAKDILLSCEIRFGTLPTTTRATYRLFDDGTKVQLGASGHVVRLHTTEAEYSWSSKSADGDVEFLERIDRHSGTITISVSGEPVATGTCELTKPKF